MGWCGYTIYSGDGTQTRHYDFIKWSGVKVSDDTIMDDGWLQSKGTKIPQNHIESFIVGMPNILKKMPKSKFWDDDSAIDWQMLLALCIDNKIKPCKIIYDKGIEATEYLMGEHASDFCNVSLRRQNLKNFIKRAKKNGYN